MATVHEKFDLTDRVAVITGGAGLLGVKHAAAIAELGGTPVIVDIAAERAQATADALAAAKAAGEPRRSYRHAVFGRVGSACRRCGRKIRREEVAGRRLYRCTGCQRRR